MLNPIPPSSRPLAIGAQRFRAGRLFLKFFDYLQGGGEVYCLDTGNCFDPYPLAKMARAKGLNPETVLGNIRVSRAATCHQIVSVVEEMILPLAAEPEGKVVLVLAIDSLFMDEDIPLFERRYLFGRILDGILQASESLGCLVTYNRGLERERGGGVWYGALAGRCRVRKPSSRLEPPPRTEPLSRAEPLPLTPSPYDGEGELVPSSPQGGEGG